MEKGHDAYENMRRGGGVTPDNGQKLLNLCLEVEVGQHGPFGKARGAARVLQQSQRRFGIGGRFAVTLAGFEQIFPGHYGNAVIFHLGHVALPLGLNGLEDIERKGEAVGQAGNDVGFNAQLVPQRRKLVPEQVESDEEFGFGIGKMVGQFLFHIQGVGHDHHAPGLERAPEGYNRLGQVGQHNGHPIAGLQPSVPQRGGHGFGLVLQLAVGHGHVLEDNGLAVAEVFRRPIQISLQGLGNNVEGGRSVAVEMSLPGNCVHEQVS